MSKTLAIYGAGGLGREVLELVKQINRRECRWERFIFVIDGEGGGKANGVDILSYLDAREQYGRDLDVTIAVGEPADRKRLFEKVRSDGWETPSLIHPDVFIPDSTTIGIGVTIQTGCFISCNLSIKNNIYIQPLTAIGHDTSIGDGCVLSSHCNLAGKVHIGAYTYIGVGACIKERVTIGSDTIIGMGAVVFRDIGNGLIVLGNPARPMKNNVEQKVFQ